MQGIQDEAVWLQPASKTLGTSGMSVLAAGTPRGPISTARAGGYGDVGEDPLLAYLTPSAEERTARSSRHAYPRRKEGGVTYDPITGEEQDSVPRRIQGFGLGFEKIFATTSFKLPVSAYTIFVELHAAHNKEVFSRSFNGLHTLMDLKKWVYEKLLVPINAYDLSYAEPGKAALTDQLRLLTTEESLDTRTFVTTQAVHRLYKGISGVHSIGDVGVTRLYLRLKCRTCGDLLNSLQTCRRFKAFGHIEPPPDTSFDVAPTGSTGGASGFAKVQGVKEKFADGERRMALAKPGARGVVSSGSKARVPGQDPTIEDLWYNPDPKRHCLFHTRGYEMFEGARTHGGHAELARIYISSGKEPSKKLKLASNVLNTGAHSVNISY